LNFLDFRKKYSNIKFNKNPSVVAELFHTDRHDEDNSRFLQFCESAEHTEV